MIRVSYYSFLPNHINLPCTAWFPMFFQNIITGPTCLTTKKIWTGLKNRKYFVFTCNYYSQTILNMTITQPAFYTQNFWERKIECLRKTEKSCKKVMLLFVAFWYLSFLLTVEVHEWINSGPTDICWFCQYLLSYRKTIPIFYKD